MKIDFKIFKSKFINKIHFFNQNFEKKIENKGFSWFSKNAIKQK